MNDFQTSETDALVSAAEAVQAAIEARENADEDDNMEELAKADADAEDAFRAQCEVLGYDPEYIYNTIIYGDCS